MYQFHSICESQPAVLHTQGRGRRTDILHATAVVAEALLLVWDILPMSMSILSRMYIFADPKVAGIDR